MQHLRRCRARPRLPRPQPPRLRLGKQPPSRPPRASMETRRPLAAALEQRPAPRAGRSGLMSHRHSWAPLLTWKILSRSFHPQKERRVLKEGGDCRAEECKGRAADRSPGSSGGWDGREQWLSHLTFPKTPAQECRTQLPVRLEVRARPGRACLWSCSVCSYIFHVAPIRVPTRCPCYSSCRRQTSKQNRAGHGGARCTPVIPATGEAQDRGSPSSRAI